MSSAGTAQPRSTKGPIGTRIFRAHSRHNYPFSLIPLRLNFHVLASDKAEVSPDEPRSRRRHRINDAVGLDETVECSSM
jgi:hypothetical protein